MVKENIAYHWKVAYFGTAMKNNHHDILIFFPLSLMERKKSLQESWNQLSVN